MASVAPARGEGGKLFGLAACARRGRTTRVSTTLCATSGTVNSQRERGRRRGEGRHAGRERIRNAAAVEPAQLLGERR